MATDCRSVISCPDGLTNNQRTELKGIGERKLPPIDAISVINLHDVRAQRENSDNAENEQEQESAYKSISKIAVFGALIIGLSVLFVIPWTTIPRTNSIIYQSYWLELLLPTATMWILDAGCDLLNLAIWTKEKSLISFNVFLKIFLIYGLFSTLFMC